MKETHETAPQRPPVPPAANFLKTPPAQHSGPRRRSALVARLGRAHDTPACVRACNTKAKKHHNLPVLKQSRKIDFIFWRIKVETSALVDGWCCNSAQFCTCCTAKAFPSPQNKSRTQLSRRFLVTAQVLLRWPKPKTMQPQFARLPQRLPMKSILTRPFCTLPCAPPCTVVISRV